MVVKEFGDGDQTADLSSAVAAVAGIVVVVHNTTPSYDYGAHKWQVMRLREDLEKKPCDTGALAALLEEMKVPGLLAGNRPSPLT